MIKTISPVGKGILISLCLLFFGCFSWASKDLLQEAHGQPKQESLFFVPWSFLLAARKSQKKVERRQRHDFPEENIFLLLFYVSYYQDGSNSL